MWVLVLIFVKRCSVSVKKSCSQWRLARPERQSARYHLSYTVFDFDGAGHRTGVQCLPENETKSLQYAKTEKNKTWKWKNFMTVRQCDLLIEINYRNELEGTHRVRTHVVLLLTITLTLTFDLKAQTVLSGYFKVITCTKLEHFGIIPFWVMLQTL